MEATIVITRNVGEYRRAVRELVEPGGRVLELGCGFGRSVELLAKAGYRVLGVDRSWEAIEGAKRRTARFKEARVERVDAFNVKEVRKLVSEHLGSVDAVMIDIGGVEDPGKVLNLARTYIKALKPKVVVVKNTLLYEFIRSCRLYEGG